MISAKKKKDTLALVVRMENRSGYCCIYVTLPGPKRWNISCKNVTPAVLLSRLIASIGSGGLGIFTKSLKIRSWKLLGHSVMLGFDR